MKIKLNELKSIIYHLLMEGDVIDAKDRFKKKRDDDFKEKLVKLASDLPNVFARQEEQEKIMNSALGDILKIPDQFIDQRRFQLACPHAYEGPEGFDEDTPIGMIIRLSGSWEPEIEQIEKKRFVQDNAESFLAACDAMDEELKRLIAWADSIHWPASWRRYTRYASTWQNIEEFKRRVNDYLK